MRYLLPMLILFAGPAQAEITLPKIDVNETKESKPFKADVAVYGVVGKRDTDKRRAYLFGGALSFSILTDFNYQASIGLTTILTMGYESRHGRFIEMAVGPKAVFQIGSQNITVGVVLCNGNSSNSVNILYGMDFDCTQNLSISVIAMGGLTMDSLSDKEWSALINTSREIAGNTQLLSQLNQVQGIVIATTQHNVQTPTPQQNVQTMLEVVKKDTHLGGRIMLGVRYKVA